MSSTPPEASEKWPRKRVLVVAAEVLLVVALVALNLYLWLRPGRDDGSHNGPTSVGAATSEATTGAATSGATPAAGESRGPSPTGTGTAGPSPAPVSSTTTTAASSVPSPPATSRVSPAAALKGAGRLVAVVDASSAMDGQLTAVKEGLSELARQAPDGVALGLVTYAGNGVQAVVAPEPLDANRRANFIRAVEGLTTSPGADRPLFDALVLAYQYALAGPPGTDPAPILLAVTNGGRSGGGDLQTFAVFAKAESDKRARSAAPHFIGITPGADVPLLTQTAAAVGGGKVVAANGPDRLRDAILDLPAPPASTPKPGSPS